MTFKNSSNVIQKTVEYVYDHDNLMIKRTETPYTAGSPGTAQSDFYVRESAQILLAFHKNGSNDAELTNRYVWTDQIDMVLSDEQVTSLANAGTVYYVLGDHQNSVVDLVTYNSGTDTTTVAKHRKFNAFGNTTLDSAPGISSIYGYTSMYFDVITSLQYNWHRWYDPFTGRWMGPDPIGFDGGDENLARAMGNNPVSNTDPDGLQYGPPAGWPRQPPKPDPKPKAQVYTWQNGGHWKFSNMRIEGLTLWGEFGGGFYHNPENSINKDCLNNPFLRVAAARWFAEYQIKGTATLKDVVLKKGKASTLVDVNVDFTLNIRQAYTTKGGLVYFTCRNFFNWSQQNLFWSANFLWQQYLNYSWLVDTIDTLNATTSKLEALYEVYGSDTLTIRLSPALAFAFLNGKSVVINADVHKHIDIGLGSRPIDTNPGPRWEHRDFRHDLPDFILDR